MDLKNSWVPLLLASVILSSLIASGVTLVLLNTPQVREAFRGPPVETLSQLTEFEQEVLYYHMRYLEGYVYSLNATTLASYLASDSGTSGVISKVKYVSRLELRALANAPWINISFKDEFILVADYSTLNTTSIIMNYWSPSGPISVLES